MLNGKGSLRGQSTKREQGAPARFIFLRRLGKLFFVLPQVLRPLYLGFSVDLP